MNIHYTCAFLFCLVFYNSLVYDCTCDNLSTVSPEEFYRTEFGVKKLISAFFGQCQLTPEEWKWVQSLKQQPQIRRKPFIVIEGTDKQGKSAVARRVAARLGAKFLKNPPACLLSLRTQFMYSIVLRRAYYALCMYASAIDINRYWYNQTVVMTGYWHHQAAFSVAKAYSLKTMPDRSLRLFQWPDDLTPPDVAFFVNPVATTGYESNYNTRTFKPRLIEAYRRLRNPTLIEVGGMLFCDQMAVEILIHLKNIFKDDYNFIINQKDPLAVNFTRLHLQK